MPGTSDVRVSPFFASEMEKQLYRKMCLDERTTILPSFLLHSEKQLLKNNIQQISQMKFYNKSTFANEMIIHDKHFEESYIVLHQQVLYSDLQK